MLFLTRTKAIHGLTLFLLLVILICDSPEILRQEDLNQRRWALCNFKHQLCDALIWGETSGKSYIRVSLSLSVSSWRSKEGLLGGWRCCQALGVAQQRDEELKYEFPSGKCSTLWFLRKSRDLIDPQGIDNCVFFSHILGDSSGTETQSHWEETLKMENTSIR